MKKGAAAKTTAGIAANIRQEAKSKPHEQAVAIAMRLAGKRKPKGK